MQPSGLSAKDASATQIQTVTKTFSANNTNVAVPIFGITGDVLIKRIWGIVTTVIGANHTGGYFKINDQTATVNITLNTGGATLSALPVGTKMVKTGLAAAIATVTSAAVGAVVEPAAAGGLIASEFGVVKKSTAATNIEYHYFTTDAPTTGAMQFFVEWQGRSADAAVSAL